MSGFRAWLRVVASCCLCLTAIAAFAEEPAALLKLNDRDNEQIGLLYPIDQSPHSGLLGKRYLIASYVYADTSNLFDDTFLDNANGFEATLNLPILKGDGSKAFAVDAFASYLMLFANDDASTPFGNMEVDIKLSDIAAGFTFYTEAFDRVRPFGQLGWRYNVADFRLTTPFGAIDDDESDDRVLLNLGTELDLTSTLAFRGVLEVDTEEFDSSLLRGDFIISPNNNYILKVGGFGQLDGDIFGFNLGAGLKF